MAEIKKISTELQLLDKFLDTSGDAGASGQILSSTGTGINWVSGSAIPGVPGGSGTVNTIPLWTPDGNTLGNSIITQPTSAEVRVAGTLKVNSTVSGYSSTKIQTGGFGDSQSGINILNSTTGYGYILFGDGSGADLYRGQITYKHDDDYMAFNAASSERMRITSTGNVGIGTTTPIAPLHIVTPAVAGVDLTDISRTANNLVRFTNPQYSTSATMGLLLRVFPDSDARQGAGLLMTGGSDNAASNLSLFVSKDDGSGNNISKSYSALHIAGNTGNVGIGTTSPDSKLDVKGTSATPADGNQTLSITNSTGGTQLNLGTAENSYGWIEAREGSTLRNLLINPNGGSVGIGTTSPTAAKLVVDSSVAPQLLVKSSSGGNAQILFEDNSGGTQNASITFDQASQNTLTIATGYQSPTDLNRINIAPAGNIGLTVRGGTGGSGLSQPLVGIGTTTPSEKLEVNGNIKVIESGQTPDVSVFHTDGSYAKLRGQGLFLSRATSYVAPVADNFGSLAVGYNGVRWGNVEINAATVKFENGSNEFMRITSTGNVGIGTTSPDCKLTVAGSGSGGVNPSTISSNTVATFRRTGGVSHNANISQWY